jgi:hypothetical protein
MAGLILKFLLWITKGKEPLLIDVDYMERWFIIPRNRFFNIYFHRFFGSDAPTPHDHPWVSMGIILEGEYLEHTPKGDFKRHTGDVTLRLPSSLHWVEIDKPVYTLFITGPRVRRWGFECKDKWVDFREYIDARGDNRLASGCGED